MSRLQESEKVNKNIGTVAAADRIGTHPDGVVELESWGRALAPGASYPQIGRLIDTPVTRSGG
jgi:hypothetical protein